MHTQMTFKALRTVALTLATLTACAAGMAAEPMMIAKASPAATTPLQRASAQEPVVYLDPYASLAEAEMIGMGYIDFDSVLAQALVTPTAAGFAAPASRQAIQEVLARTMSGLMP
jgi:hypothetical protein